MQLRHLKTIRPPGELVDGRFQKVTAIAWSPNNYRLAVATTDRYITLYDEDGVQRDKFLTKPAEKDGPKNYVIKGLEFSQDGTKLAVAQSDNIVFVYKLGKTWADKKTICSKYATTSPVTCMCWPSQRINEIVFGTADGKLSIGNAANKTIMLYNSDSYVVSLHASPDGHSFISGHTDGTIMCYTFPTADGKPATQSVICQVPFVPYALGWGQHIVVAGNSSQVKVFDTNGRNVQNFEYANNSNYDIREFTSVAVNPSGQTIVLGNFNCFLVYAFNGNRNMWEESSVVNVSNIYTITAMRWKSDGSRLTTGSLCGVVDLYDACLRKIKMKGDWDVTYTSASSLILKSKKENSDARISLKSRFGCEIKNIKLYQDRYAVAHTTETLMVCDTAAATPSVAEVRWNYNETGHGKDKQSRERFFFDNDFSCMVHYNGELNVIEYGATDILGSCRTEHVSSHLLSVRINEARHANENAVKKIAYLLDKQTIRIFDLATHLEQTINHDAKIDWLELNQRGNKLLFRDKKRQLHLYDVTLDKKTTLRPYCNYVQWVPDSDVCVCQSRRSLCVWYSIDHPENVTEIPIKGDVEQIERTSGRTEVHIDEGIQHSTIPLDESLIAFGSSVDAHDFKKAVSILEALPNQQSAGATAMWTQLSKLALEAEDYNIAERCFSALGDVSKTKFLRKINALIQQYDDNKEHYLVKAHLAMLNKNFKRAESILLQNGNIDECIAMYRQLHKWDDALTIAETRNHPQSKVLRQQYFNYLINTKQEEVAGELKERNREYDEALQLYLKGGFPAKAADLVLRQGHTHDQALCESVANALIANKQYEKAGEFLESLRLFKRALEMYCKAHAYSRAVELARREFQNQVVRLEEEWGDYLVSQKQMDAASNHYIQAGVVLKAIHASVEARAWGKAVQMLDQLDKNEAKPFLKKVAAHMAETKRYAEAERYYLQADLAQEAVQMYTAAGMWDKAHKIASTYMSQQQVNSLYVSQAQKLESAGKLKEAEKLYLSVQEPDLAIQMYKRNRQYDDMIRLMTAHRSKEAVFEAHMQLARQFEQESNFKLAEQHHVKSSNNKDGSGQGWKNACKMYQDNDMWEDALRVAKAHGGMQAYKQYAYTFAMSQGAEAGVKLLIKLGLGEVAVEYAVERGEFQQAFLLAERVAKHKLADVHLQYAMALEDQGRFAQAEEEFLKAKKPKEAIEMYLHQQEWDAAMKVAEQYDQPSIPDVYEAQAKVRADEKNFPLAEALFLNAKKPEAAVKMYQMNEQWDDALRVAKIHAPRLVNQLQHDRTVHVSKTAPVNSGDYLASQAKLLVNNKAYTQAIDAYLKIGKEHTNDLDSLERVWENAVALAMEHVPARIHEVVGVVSKRLLGINRHDQAAELFLSIEDHKAAVDAFIAGKKFDKARGLASAEAPHLLNYVEKAYQDDLIRNDKIQDLGALNPEAAIDVHVTRNEWNKVYELAAKQGHEVLQKYTSMHAAILVKDAKYREALAILVKYGAIANPNHFEVYKRVATELLRNPPDERHKQDEKEIYVELREFLFKLVSNLQDTDQSRATQEFERLLLITHFCATKVLCEQMDLKPIAAKLATSLLRYTVEVPVDKAFYDAATLCRDQGQLGMAFVFFNRFVDITDRMSDPDSGDIDNSDFMQTDIPSPFQVPLPARQYYSDEKREEAREWVLEKAMSNEISQSLSIKPCDKCNKDTYEANVTCHSCHQHSTPCIVSGYPVLKNKRVACKTCQKVANKDEWNKYVSKMKNCPWCGSASSPVF